MLGEPVLIPGHLEQIKKPGDGSAPRLQQKKFCAMRQWSLLLQIAKATSMPNGHGLLPQTSICQHGPCRIGWFWQEAVFLLRTLPWQVTQNLSFGHSPDGPSVAQRGECGLVRW